MYLTFTNNVFLLEAGSLHRLSWLCHAGSVAQLSVQLHLRFLIISQDQRDQSYSTVKTTSTAVTVNNLKPGTLYIFQIRTSSSPDYGSYNPGIEVETLAECKCSRARVPGDAVLTAHAPAAPGVMEQQLLLWFCCSRSKGEPHSVPLLARNLLLLAFSH